MLSRRDKQQVAEAARDGVTCAIQLARESGAPVVIVNQVNVNVAIGGGAKVIASQGSCTEPADISVRER